eukprot:SAG31_NODE_22867_length_516_cov_0.990408_1_plen_73_part_00
MCLHTKIAEVYSAGVVRTMRCLLPKGALSDDSQGVDLFANGGSATLLKLEAWELKTMWEPVGGIPNVQGVQL